MCDPMSAMIGLQRAGTAVSAAGQIAQGNNAAVMGRLQQQAYEQQADAVRKQAGYESQREFHKQELAAGNARAQVGASGVAFDGSPTDVLVANAGEGELDLQAIQFGSKVKQGQLRTQGALSAFGGRQAQQAGYISGVSTLATGVGKAFMPNRSVQFGQSVFA